MWDERQPGERAAGRQHLRILIADDHPGTQRALQLLLLWLECSSDVVDDGQAALEAIRSRDYDIVFMDVVMPRMDGVEATRQIRRSRPFDVRPRIVGMSADTTPEDRQVCLDVGMDDFLPKPVDVESLVRILDEEGMHLFAIG
jgi:CheY-like chemotaxis protein